jgi:2-polyprenyl-3-methyl-5-hydroxy-6-metoxy-1,4-benzoquinol methylase
MRTHPQLHWDLRCIGDNAALHADACLCPPQLKMRRYSIRWLRYWFVYQLLQAERARLGRPLAVCEIGIGAGQMRRFMNVVGAPAWSRWVGVDCKLLPDQLNSLGYDALVEANLQTDVSWCRAEYDAFILLHILEHLLDPETAMKQLAEKIRPGSIIIGGYPSVPDWCIRFREPKLRRTAQPFGHVTALSARRTRAMAAAAGLELEFLTGAFCARAGGFVLEDCEWWTRFNLRFGSMFPSWPGELYWVMRKPE